MLGYQWLGQGATKELVVGQEYFTSQQIREIIKIISNPFNITYESFSNVNNHSFDTHLPNTFICQPLKYTGSEHSPTINKQHKFGLQRSCKCKMKLACS